jgi:DNA processing protein
MTDKEYLVALYAFTGFGPIRIRLLLNYFKSAKRVWELELDEILKVGLHKNIAEKFTIHRNNFDFTKYFQRLEKLGIKYTTNADREYPKNLRDLEDAPVVIYYMGVLSNKDESAVAIVGSRKMTPYGKEIAEKFSRELGKHGITIVSGLARGVDTVVHRGALSVGGRTIAVIASGLDRIYPPENTKLVYEIIRMGGAVMSEYPLGYPPLPSNFPLRNRIVSGISKAILVVEGLERSGTLITASHAAEQGRSVFAVPGRITSPTSGAPHFLLQNGAKLALSPKDILDELSLEIKVDNDEETSLENINKHSKS